MNRVEQSSQLCREGQRSPHVVRCVLLLCMGALLGLALFSRVRTAVGMRKGDQTTVNKKRHFNKHWSNPIIMTLGRAGQPHSIFALIKHVGRRSGQSYTTPVRVVPVEGGFIIPLTYGHTADWYRNLQARGGGQLQWQGKIYTVGQPEMVTSTQVLSAFPLPSRFLFWLDGVPQFVHVSQTS